jgi:hypothetical protein
MIGSIILQIAIAQGPIPNGTIYEYNENGLVTSIKTYINGTKHGVFIDFDDRGSITKIYSYFNGELDGHHRTYTRGFINHEITYERGKRIGEERWYYFGAKPKLVNVFENDTMVYSTGYTESGEIKFEIDYKQKEKTGGNGPSPK